MIFKIWTSTRVYNWVLPRFIIVVTAFDYPVPVPGFTSLPLVGFFYLGC